MKENKILIIDDEQGWRDLLYYELTMEGFKAITVQSGEEGVKIVEDNGFILIIIDIRMPGIDGIETIKKIKQIKPDMKFIMVTGYAEEEKIKKGIELGAATYFYKPLELDRLMTTVKEICN